MRAQIGTRTGCSVFFDEPDVPYADVIRAIDLIKQLPARSLCSHRKQNGFDPLVKYCCQARQVAKLETDPPAFLSDVHPPLQRRFTQPTIGLWS